MSDEHVRASAYGTITNPSELRREAEQCLDYVQSDRFPVPPFAPYFARELRAILALSAGGRRPVAAERRNSSMGRVIFSEFDEAGVPREGEWAEMHERLLSVSMFFEDWPTEAQVRGEGDDPFVDLVCVERKYPSHAAVAAAADRIIAEMRRMNLWSDERLPSEKFAFQGRFAADTMTPEQWLQFVFLPKMQNLIAERAELPEQISLSALARDSQTTKPSGHSSGPSATSTISSEMSHRERSRR